MGGMPEMFPGPNGHPLHVAPAIIKRIKEGPQYATRGTWPNGMRRTIWQHGQIVRCGRAGSGCRGVLGYLTSRYLALTEELRIDASAALATHEWTMVHPDRFGGSEQTGYRVLDADSGKRSRTGARIGRAPMPKRLVASDAQPHPGTYGSRQIVGQVPALPCIVFCPTCGMPSWVEAPEDDPPVGKR